MTPELIEHIEEMVDSATEVVQSSQTIQFNKRSMSLVYAEQIDGLRSALNNLNGKLLKQELYGE